MRWDRLIVREAEAQTRRKLCVSGRRSADKGTDTDNAAIMKQKYDQLNAVPGFEDQYSKTEGEKKQLQHTTLATSPERNWEEVKR